MDTKQDQGKVDAHTLVNCHNDDWNWAMHEFASVQAMNTRSKKDKTYHLVVSFPVGEKPALDVLNTISDELASDLGYAEHQRLTAVHNDTEHYHMHIVINKIHPTKYTAIEPYYDHYQLSQSCQRLEQKFDLLPDNHIEQSVTRKARGVDTTSLKEQGITPLVEWLKDRIDLDAVDSWDNLHKQAHKNGVSLVKKGAGLAFFHADDGIFVKASSIDRSLSKANLEKRMGVFQDAASSTSQVEHYDMHACVKNEIPQGSSLWDEFQHLRKKGDERYEALAEKNNHSYQRIGSKFTLKYARMRKGQWIQNYEYKKQAYALLKKQRMNAVQSHTDKYKSTLKKNKTSMTWHKFLQEKAHHGDEEALYTLRRRQLLMMGKDKDLLGEKSSHLMIADKSRIVNKNGTVTYQKNHMIIVDYGDLVTFKGEPCAQGREFMRALAGAKFGAYAVNGDKFFKKSMKGISDNMPREVALVDEGIQAYIYARNKAAKSIKSIVPHRLYENYDAGDFYFEGLRRLDGAYAMLLKKDNAMLVKPISAEQYKSMNAFRRGSTVNVFDNGNFKIIQKRKTKSKIKRKV